MTSKHAHRRGLSDLEWAHAQPKDQSYFIGDVVQFHQGGFGIIDAVTEPQNGWPPSYSIARISGLPSAGLHLAWHYECDFLRLVAPSALRTLNCEGIVKSMETKA